MTETTTIHALSIERLQELLQGMGYRVTVAEREGQRQLLSAAQGIGFSARPGNPAPAEGEFIDYTLSCALRLQGDGSLPAGLVENWNIQKRFSRLSLQGTFLVLEMDVIVVGGVTATYLRATAELWDRLLQELVLYLREYSSKAAATPGSLAPSADTSAAAAALESNFQGAEGSGAPAPEASAAPRGSRVKANHAQSENETEESAR